MQIITTHYIDGVFVPSHGHEVLNIIRPTDRQVIARVAMADEEDTLRAIAAAKRAFATYGRSTIENRAKLLRRLYEAASERIDHLTAAMVEEYGGVVRFARMLAESGVNAFKAAEDALQNMEWTRSWGKTTVTLEPVGVAGLITAWNANALFICLKLASAVAAGCTVVIKPSELSAMQTQVLLEALDKAGLPNGLLNVVTGRGDIVIAYDTDKDAIRIANDSRYGLYAFVNGTDLARARQVAGQLRAGRVAINGMTDDPQAPWGGFKFSGVGREYGAYGINAFLETRAILEAE